MFFVSWLDDNQSMLFVDSYKTWTSILMTNVHGWNSGMDNLELEVIDNSSVVGSAIIAVIRLIFHLQFSIANHLPSIFDYFLKILYFV